MAADSWLPVYSILPPWLQDVAASVRGLQLRRWRYGPETERLVEEALDREGWSAEQWKRWQEERTARLLYRAAKHVPYYRAMWTQRRVRGDRSSWELLENWPVLDKEAVRQNARAFLADDCDPRRMYAAYTSGSTGTPLKIWQSRETSRAWYALFEARWRHWHGVSRHDRWAILGGQLVTPVARRKPPFWVHNWPMRQLYCSVYHLAPDLMQHYVSELRRFQPAYLWGYTSALYSLALGCADLGVKDLRFKVILTNAEPLYDHQREFIQQVFQTPVRETYGMTEMVAAAGECEIGHMHWFPDAGIVEILNQETDETGELVATGLINFDMPLIRYRVGDRVRPARPVPACPCGRQLPRLARLEGRLDDVIITPDGRCIGRLDPVFKSDLAIREAQMVQEAIDVVRIRLVPTEQFTERYAELIRKYVSERLGDCMRVEIELVKEIERGPNGKFRAVVSRIGRQ